MIPGRNGSSCEYTVNTLLGELRTIYLTSNCCLHCKQVDCRYDIKLYPISIMVCWSKASGCSPRSQVKFTLWHNVKQLFDKHQNFSLLRCTRIYVWPVTHRAIYVTYK